MTNRETNDWRKLYETIYAGQDSDYIVNEEQLSKFKELFGFISDLAAQCNGSISVDLKPSHIAGGLTAKFIVLQLEGQELKRFCELLSAASAVTFDVEQPDKVCISINIPDVYKKK